MSGEGFQTRLLQAMCRWLVRQWERDPDDYEAMPMTVTGYEYEPAHDDGYCDTCSYWEPDMLTIRYTDVTGWETTRMIEIRLDEFLKELT